MLRKIPDNYHEFRIAFGIKSWRQCVAKLFEYVKILEKRIEKLEETLEQVDRRGRSLG